MTTFTTVGSSIVEYKGRNGTVSVPVAGGLVFSVDKRKGALPIDLSGRTVNEDVYKQYFAPPEPKSAPVPKPEQTQEEE